MGGEVIGGRFPWIYTVLSVGGAALGPSNLLGSIEMLCEWVQGYGGRNKAVSGDWTTTKDRHGHLYSSTNRNISRHGFLARVIRPVLP